jgi:hypothetical protein
MQPLQAALHRGLVRVELGGQLLTQALQGGALLGQELMQGRVQQADGHGEAIHGTEDALKVLK